MSSRRPLADAKSSQSKVASATKARMRDGDEIGPADGAGPALDAFLEGLSPECGFNSSRMVFLPKTPSGTDAEVGEFYDPGDTRPLNIANCDNRLLATAVRLRIEPHDCAASRW